MKFSSILIHLMLFNSIYSFGQQIQQVIPPSPITREFDKYLNYPVSLYNGIPEINIPLYQIKLNGITIPIELSYHASGIKYKQNSGEVGVGWVLNPRYRVSKTVYGRDDESYSMPNQFSDPLNSFGNQYDRDLYLTKFYNDGSVSTWYPTATQILDGEYDVYTYGLGNSNGTFIYTDRVNKVFSFLEESGMKITHSPAFQDNHFTIIDVAGNKFNLGKNSAIESIGSQSFSWLASEIVTVYDDSIKFQYVNRVVLDESNVASATVQNGIGCQSNNSGGCATIWNTKSSSDIPVPTSYNTPLLSSITTPSEKIYFNHQANSTLLDNIEIYNVLNNLIQRIEFNYSHNGYYTFLSSVCLNKKGGDCAQYSFAYFPGDANITNTTFDDWGYHYYFSPINGNKDNLLPESLAYSPLLKDETGNDNKYPYQFLNNENFILFDKTVNSAPNSFSIQRITHPTGGFTEFEFESNRISNASGGPRDGSGLRIKRIISNTGGENNIPAIIKEYKYGSNEDGLGLAAVNIEAGDFVSEGIYAIHDLAPQASFAPSFRLTQTQISYSNKSNSEAISDGASKIFYPEVVEYQKNIQGQVLGKSKYHFSVPSNWYTSYDKIQSNSTYPWKWTSSGFTESKSRTFYPKIIKNFTPWIKPQQIAHNTYNYDGNAFNLIESVENVYSDIERSVHTGLKVRPFLLWADHPFTLTPYGQSPYDALGLNSLFDYSLYSISSGVQRQTQKIVKSFSLNNQLTTIYSYSYNQNDQLIKQEKSDSRSGLTINEYTYPTDYNNLAGSDPVTLGVLNLKNRNVLLPVIESSVFKQNNTGSKALINSSFTVFNINLPTPKNILKIENSIPLSDFVKSVSQAGTITKDNRYVPFVNFEIYDNHGNLLQQGRENNIREAYIWGYNNQYPVARVLNKNYVDAISQSGLDLTLINNPATTDAAMRTELNKLRALANTFVTTYTYKPLVGMTSETDPNGRTMTYEYDSFNRLVVVKDKDGNVVKKICYNYAGQPENCLLQTIFTNTPQSQVFTRNNCGACSQGSQVTYNVAAGTYSSTIDVQAANQLALNDIATNGQNYANSVGTCSSGADITINFENPSLYSSYTATYTNLVTNQVYVFNIPASATGNLGCIPPGNYSLSIVRTGGGLSPFIMFGTGCHVIEGQSAYFGNVNLAFCHSVLLDTAF